MRTTHVEWRELRGQHRECRRLARCGLELGPVCRAYRVHTLARRRRR